MFNPHLSSAVTMAQNDQLLPLDQPSSSTTTTGFPQTCSLGQFFTGGPCLPCSAGTYQNEEHHTKSCKQCERGTYAPGEGAIECIPCEAGNLVIFSSSNTLWRLHLKFRLENYLKPENKFFFTEPQTVDLNI